MLAEALRLFDERLADEEVLFLSAHGRMLGGDAKIKPATVSRPRLHTERCYVKLYCT